MKTLTKLAPDVLIVAGAAAFSFGVGLLHPAAGCIAAGVLMMVGGVLASVNIARTKVEA